MFLNQATKSFLLEVLSTPSPFSPGGAGGAGITGSYWLSNPSSMPTPPKGAGKDWYTKLIQSTSSSMGVTFDPTSYKSGPALETLAALGMLKRGMGYGTQPKAGTEFLGGPDFSSGASFAKSLIPTAAKIGLASAALSTMGPIGAGLERKLPYLAALGIDPFDYATKIMGVDYAADQLSKLAARQQKQITSGEGYIKL